jgi:hypothetical protein
MSIIHWCKNKDVSNYDDDDNDSTPTELLTNGQTASLEENQGCVIICCTVKFIFNYLLKPILWAKSQMPTAPGLQDRLAYSEQVLGWGYTTEELWFFSRQKE